jgi:hypothetical protein
LVLRVPEGVILASDRGFNGSPGALIYSDDFKTRPLIRIDGPDARITGLRLRGPDTNLREEVHLRANLGSTLSMQYYSFPVSGCIRTTYSALTVDNCELWGWSHSAVGLSGGKGHHIHHNYIHHNRRFGLGYGVSHGRTESLIEYNLFDNNRHHIAGSGRSGCGYEARHNVVLRVAHNHLFDMHGGRDRENSSRPAGTWIHVHHNTFMATHQEALRARGTPEKEAILHHNWFYHPIPGFNVVFATGNTKVYDNAYGNPPELMPEAEEAAYDFSKAGASPFRHHWPTEF